MEFEVNPMFFPKTNPLQEKKITGLMLSLQQEQQISSFKVVEISVKNDRRGIQSLRVMHREP